MKMKQKDILVERGENIIESSFGISSKDSAHILNILRDKLYSNKILAVVREYCTNAQDAHKEIGKLDPIEVSLPNRLNQHFTVRDFGPGLSEEDVRNIYVMYGASTKRQSNAVVGQLGLGCKAAFAYTDKFNVTSWHGGEKKIYTAYIDETGVGKIALLSSSESTEPEGIEVSIPVKAQDNCDFAHETKELLRFFDPLPVVHGIDIGAFNYYMEEAIGNGVHFKLVDKSEGSWSYVIMGGVPYRINRSSVEVKDGYEAILSLGIHLFVNIGDVDVAAHREALEYTEETKKTVNKYIEEAAEKALKTKANMICKALTYREANQAFISINNYHPFWRKIQNIKTWKNKKLDGQIIPQNIVCSMWRPSYQGNGYRWHEKLSVHSDEKHQLFIIDDPKQWKQKMGQWMNYKNINPNNVYVIRIDTKDQKEVDKFWAERELDDYTITPISQCDVPKTVLKTLKNRATGRPRSNTHIGNVFVLKEESKRPRLRNTKSKDWDRAEGISDGLKYYVELDMFFVKHNDVKYEIDKFEEFLSVAKGLGFVPDKIYGVKKAQVEKLNDDWIPLMEKIKESIQASNLVQNLRDLKEYESNITSEIEAIIAEGIEFPEGSTARELIDTTKEIKENIKTARQGHDKYKLERVLRVLKIKDIDANPTSDLKEIIRRTRKRYPLIADLGIFPGIYAGPYRNYHYHDRQRDIRKIKDSLVEYIKLIEGEKNDVFIHLNGSLCNSGCRR